MLLETGVEPVQAWPAASAGLQALLYEPELLRDAEDDAEAARAAHAGTRRKIPSRFDTQLPSLNRAAKLTQEALRLHREDLLKAPLSAIRVHPRLADLIAAAQRLLCDPGWFLDPSRAVFVAVDEEERTLILALLRRPMVGQATNEDPLAAAQWVAEELMPLHPGLRHNKSRPVRLASEISPEDSFREVILSPRCWEQLAAKELLRVIYAARVGIHTLRKGGDDQVPDRLWPERPWDWTGWDWDDWDWEEQDRKQACRLEGMTCFRFPGTSEAEIHQALADAEKYRANLRAAEEVSRARQARLEQMEAKHRARVKFQ
ncbi:hypothetical protein KBZ12_10850 [Cyanobium sp. Cruz CV13-4-11]|uniref:hypothetical protein n=1 Tax=Cyanobium sp. Cruz CV11-17 TaxID=2823709 RepID=UPI0020CC4B5B|nr:hypothetical protein [Cyanobium sp. Cruz CV11-17]MCP9919968.1 hypothetical protein [Cyanobium sp. Cruz CV13-4-11]